MLLQTLDHLWREHLVMLEHLRQVIGLRGYGQRDPLNEYKAEAYNLFEAMSQNLREQVTGYLMRIQVMDTPPEQSPDLPYMEAHHLNPDNGMDYGMAEPTLAPAHGRQRQHRARRRPQSLRSDELGQGRPQRGLPLRLRQEVQALPRAVCLRTAAGLRRRVTLSKPLHRSAIDGGLPQTGGSVSASLSSEVHHARSQPTRFMAGAALAAPRRFIVGRNGAMDAQGRHRGLRCIRA